MTTFDGVRVLFETGTAADGWADDWSRSEAHRPNGCETAPDEAFFGELAARINIGPEARQACARASVMLRDNPVLWRLFRHCHWCLFGRDGYPHDAMAHWPPVPAAVHPAAPLFYALVLLAGIPAVLERNRVLSIPDAITLETLGDLDRWLIEYRKVHGCWGYSNLYWLWNHFQGRIFSLGRLQFCFDPYGFDYRAFRHRDNTGIRLMAPAGIKVRTDGQYDGVSGVRDPAAFITGGWETPGRIQAHPVSPDGWIQPAAETLDKREWEEVLSPRDTGISVHIPAGTPLDPALCAASFQQAEGFFRRHFPDYTVRAYFTVTWLFDNTLAQVLPPDSNVIRFQRMFHLFPFPQANDRQMWERVFDSPGGRPANPPCRTSLQRAILAHIDRGGHFHIGGGLILPTVVAATPTA